jgi:hypothetical protein
MLRVEVEQISICQENLNKLGGSNNKSFSTRPPSHKKHN